MSTTSDNQCADGAAREKILQAAEFLVADQGFDGVTLDEVAGKSGASIDTVLYLFGDREGLLDFLLERHIRPINMERLRLLDALEREAGEKVPPVDQVLEAFMRPMLDRMARHDAREVMYFKMLGRCMGERGYHLPASLMPVFEQVSGRFAHVLRRIMPDLPEDVIIWRMHFVFGAVAHTLVHGGNLFRISQGRSGVPSPETIMTRLIRFCAAGLQAPAGESALEDDWLATDLRQSRPT